MFLQNEDEHRVLGNADTKYDALITYIWALNTTQNDKSETVAEFGDSLTFLRQCGQGFTNRVTLVTCVIRLSNTIWTQVYLANSNILSIGASTHIRVCFTFFTRCR